MQASPHTKSWDTWQHIDTYYKSLKSMGAPVTFISENEDFDPHEYPFMIAPAFSMTGSTIIRKWQQYAENGGNLILTCRTGSKDNNGHFPETLLQQPIWKLIGARMEDTDQLPPSVRVKLKQVIVYTTGISGPNCSFPKKILKLWRHMQISSIREPLP
ncbi:MAG: hypothetical protein HC905_06690 [Bacteroidales bacterium]|nr:hypothetical protein [Bacteroidales bacterium]